MTNLAIKEGFLKKHKKILLSLLGIGVLGLILVTPTFLNLVEFLGKRIPQENIKLDYIKGVLWAVFLGATILLWPVRAQDKKALLWIWLIKCLVMLGLMLFYEYHYQSDTFGLFSLTRNDISIWETIKLACTVVPGVTPGEGRELPVTIITYFHRISWLNSFHAIKVSFGMISLLAVYIYYRSIIFFLRQEKIVLLYVLALFPSILFWSSMLGKDPIIFLYGAIYCYGVVRWLREPSFFNGIILVLGLIAAASMRPWWGFIGGLPALIITMITVSRKYLKIKLAMSLILVVIIVFFSNRVIASFGLNFKNLADVLNHKYNNFSGGTSVTNKDSQLTIKSSDKVISNTVMENKIEVKIEKKVESAVAQNVPLPNLKKYKGFKDVISYIPQGVFTILFRPFPSEVRNIFGLLAGIEDLFLFLLFILSIAMIRRIKLNEPLLIWAILLVITWAIAYSFVGYNFGTVCRYRIQIIPVFLSLLIYFVFTRKDALSNKKNN